MAIVRVRVLVAVAVVTVLAGCAVPEEHVLEAAPPRWVTPEPAVLAEGSYVWHDTSSGGPANALSYYDLASQAVAHPCVWDGGGGGEEVYFNNLHLPTGMASQGLGDWSGNLSVSLDWTDQDWIGTTLRIAYQAPGLEGWRETEPIERGSELVVPIRVVPANITGEGDAEPASSDWAVWVCLGDDTTGGPPEPFMGSVQAKVVFAPDPILEAGIPQAPGDEGRTARGG
jgi:hypothetical protein